MGLLYFGQARLNSFRGIRFGSFSGYSRGYSPSRKQAVREGERGACVSACMELHCVVSSLPRLLRAFGKIAAHPKLPAVVPVTLFNPRP